MSLFFEVCEKPKHKVFISFYHSDDSVYKEYIDDNLSDNIINKSVKDGEYDSENSDGYVKRLIREEKVSDSSVVVVLVGPNTWKRKHIDWEIYAGLSVKVNSNAGLVGVLLPKFPLLSNGNYLYKDLPGRLADNVKTGYADIYLWNYFISNFDRIIENAFKNRINRRNLIDNSRLQLQKNLGH